MDLRLSQLSTASPEHIRKVIAALKRARINAELLAAQTGTAMVYSRDDQIVHEWPGKRPEQENHGVL